MRGLCKVLKTLKAGEGKKQKKKSCWRPDHIGKPRVTVSVSLCLFGQVGPFRCHVHYAVSFLAATDTVTYVCTGGYDAC